MIKENIPCPICGKHIFKEWDDFRICKVCGWENVGLDMRHPERYTGSPNGCPLNAAKEGYAKGMTLEEARDKWRDENLEY